MSSEGARFEAIRRRAHKVYYDVERSRAIARDAPGYGTYRLVGGRVDTTYIGRPEANGYGLTLEDVETRIADLELAEQRQNERIRARYMADRVSMRASAREAGYRALLADILGTGSPPP